MDTYISKSDINIQDGLFNVSIPFTPGLNIISGENGTFKTKLLREIKSGRFVTNDPTKAHPRIQAISPKRNSERQAIENIFQNMRAQNRTFDTYINERGGTQINDSTFEKYPSIGELFFYVYELRGQDGTKPAIDHMQAITQEFNNVIGSVFSEYQLISEWRQNPSIYLLKHQSIRVPVDGLSLGEQEVMALITNLYASREKYDTFLIDEPEVHLNWHLEEKLFEYFDNFCTRYDKQMIVVTHSRVIFKEKLLPKTRFLYWDDQGRVAHTTDLPAEKRRRLAGEAIEIIKLGDYSKPTFFVEDEAQEIVVKAIARALNADVTTANCANKANVRSLYKRTKNSGELSNAYFLEDGDNEGSPFHGDAQFIHLAKYCIENYLIDVNICSTITDKSNEELKQLLVDQIKANKDKILGKHKYLDFLIDQLTVENLTDERLSRFDVSTLFPSFLLKLGFDREDYIEKYVSEANRQNILARILPSELVVAIQSPLT